jgi:hypothetical protein
LDIEDIAKKIKDYQFMIGNTESYRTNIFLDLIRTIFPDAKADHPEKIYPELEKSIRSSKTVVTKEVKGRMDAFSGNLIIEFEVNLMQARKDKAEDQLKKYVSILWNTLGKVRYTCMSTDGLTFLVYKPRSKTSGAFTKDNIELQLVDKFDVREENPRFTYQRFDRYLFNKALLVPTSEDIVSRFGSKGPTIIHECIDILTDAWKASKEYLQIIYEEWN